MTRILRLQMRNEIDSSLNFTEGQSTCSVSGCSCSTSSNTGCSSQVETATVSL